MAAVKRETELDPALVAIAEAAALDAYGPRKNNRVAEAYLHRVKTAAAAGVAAALELSPAAVSRAMRLAPDAISAAGRHSVRFNRAADAARDAVTDQLVEAEAVAPPTRRAPVYAEPESWERAFVRSRRQLGQSWACIAKQLGQPEPDVRRLWSPVFP
jgi:hypothetical protein